MSDNDGDEAVEQEQEQEQPADEPLSAADEEHTPLLEGTSGGAEQIEIVVVEEKKEKKAAEVSARASDEHDAGGSMDENKPKPVGIASIFPINIP